VVQWLRLHTVTAAAQGTGWILTGELRSHPPGAWPKINKYREVQFIYNVILVSGVECRDPIFL